MKPTHILGISAFYHDSAACLVTDGEIVAAAEEERFTRKKHDPGFPLHAIDYCLAAGGIAADQLDYVAFYDKPLLKLDRLLETYLAFAPAGFRSFLKAMPAWLHEKLDLPVRLREGLKERYRGRFVFTEHHESHAASAFFPSPYEEAAILTLDGVGEWATASLGLGRGNRIELLYQLEFPHSLGLLYSAFTYFTGFKVNSGEYKLMGLAPYGQPRFAQRIDDYLIDLKEDGSFRVDLGYFNYCQGLTMTSPRMDALFEGPPRTAGSELTQREMDIAASVQSVTEEVMLRSARHLARETGARKLVLAGGVALNCVGNGKLLRDGCFDDLWIQPAAGDAGGAIGTALFVWYQLLENRRLVDGVHDRQKSSLLGPAWSSDEVASFLTGSGIPFHRQADEERLLETIVDQVAAGKVVGLFQGRMEFGPRALGNRLIVGDPRSPHMQSVMNLKIKFRESFRPFAPSVLREDVDQWFEMKPGLESPYMMLTVPVAESRRAMLPAVTHVDHSARVQTVDERNGRFYRLLEKVKQRTGCPILINTSFNVRGEPMVCSPQDAHRCFMACDLDVLVLEDCVLFKEEQPAVSREQISAHRARFELD